MRSPAVELTTVADDLAVVHRGADVRTYTDLSPDTSYLLDGVDVQTLPRPGELLAVFATVNDVHFGETECGVLGDLVAPTFRVPPGTEPYPVTMNHGAIAEIQAIEPAAVVVKGDLTADGTVEQYEQFLELYGPAFGDRLHHIRGNHDAYLGGDFAPRGPFEIELPGVRIALIDTVIDGETRGGAASDQLEWLDEVAARSDRPVVVLGHHHVWHPDLDPEVDWFFGIEPPASRQLAAIVARRRSIVAYSAGHTHRNRVVHLPSTGTVPWGEVACVKDFPGSWAEYRVYDGGILQVHHRVSTPEALAWSELTRDLYQPFDYVDYAFGALSDRCFAISLRD